ncbi:MAG: TlpA family protein disulfide reductase, partial [Clostridia bacterium]|nr:TlpA family protein disulfide reductase [Clostridia bacterium]
MDELAAWSASMPENMQLVGLVSDLYSLEDAETLEMAQLICESTGADNYLHLVTSADFNGLMSTVVGVPTTYFVDATGAVVGQPIVGANVPGCMAFVEDYLNAQ